MNRRDVMQQMGVIMGGAIVSPSLLRFLEGKKPLIRAGEARLFFAADKEKLAAEIADTIIPPTGTPGAKEAGVGPLIILLLNDCYSAKDQKIMNDGFDMVETMSNDMYKKSFVDLSLADRTEVLKKVEANAIADKKAGVKGPNFWPMIKELSMMGYFTSEAGATKALEYVPVPGAYHGCIDLKPGQKAWAT